MLEYNGKREFIIMKWPTITCLVLMTIPGTTWSATKFVNHSASGSNNGSSWANAWTNVSGIAWGGLAAGDVVCVAGGSYSGSIVTGANGSSGSPITIRRATAADPTCGSGTIGWNSSFDSQVVIAAITLGNNYVTIDGAVTSGFLINLANGSGDPSAISVSGPTNDVVLRYIEVAGPCGSNACNQNGDSRSINLNNWNGSSYDLQNNMTIQYDNLHGSCTILWSAHSTNLIIEHTRFADSADSTPGNPNCHPNVIAEQDSTNVTFRYNEITNWQVEGIMACPNGGCSSTWNIYGNIWHDPMSGSYPRVLEAQGNSNGPYLVYDNTFVNMPYICASTANSGSFASGTQGRNNMFYGNSFANCGLPSEDYDYSDRALSGEAHGQGSSPNIFVNLSGKNFHLTQHTNAGLNLGSPFNIDYDGNTRANWDRGAYEYVGGQNKPQPPTNLTATPH
jgi:hypothetical protein